MVFQNMKRLLAINLKDQAGTKDECTVGRFYGRDNKCHLCTLQQALYLIVVKKKKREEWLSKMFSITISLDSTRCLENIMANQCKTITTTHNSAPSAHICIVLVHSK